MPQFQPSLTLCDSYCFRVENITVMWNLPIGGDKPMSASLRVNPNEQFRHLSKGLLSGMQIYTLIYAKAMGGKLERWSVVKSIGCSFKGCRFDSQHLHDSSYHLYLHCQGVL